MASRRNYATIDEVEQYADVTSTDDTEFEDQISQAEELIDDYVGFQQKAVPDEYHGTVVSYNVGTKTLVDSANISALGKYADNYFAGCELLIISGTGKGGRATIESSSKSGSSITLATALDTSPDTTSVYKIYQLGKFPRVQDVYILPDNSKYTYTIPEKVKRATAAQMEFMINQGAKFFGSDQSDMESERIGNYSYSKGSAGGGASSTVKMIAPKARALLKGIRNSTGQLIANNPTGL